MTAATKKTNSVNGKLKGPPPNPATKAKRIERVPMPKLAKPASDPPSSTPIEMDVAHERRQLGSVWREPRSNIRRSTTNPRTVFELDELIATLKSQGQLVPIIVRFRPDTDSGTDYEIIDGESRDRAFEILGWDVIEVKLVEMTDEQVEEVQLVTTLSRADLKPLDEAHAFERLERKGYSIAQIADRVGKREPYIRQRLALARLTDEAKAALRDGAISVGAAQELAAVTDETAQRNVVARALEGRAPGADPMTAKQIRMFVEQSLLVLSKAKFALDDASLVPAVGACSTCPKRSSQQYALIALAGAGDDERCTDRSCFVSKQEAHWTRSAEAARAAGQMVIEGDAARKVLSFGGVAKDSGYVELDGHCAELRDGRTWKEILGEDALPVSLVRGAEGVVHRVVPKADAVRILRERGLLRAPGQVAQAPVAPAETPASDAAPESDQDEGPDTVPPSVPKPTLLTPDQIAKAAKRARLDGATFSMLVEAIVLAVEPADVETVNICKPYDVPVPPDVEGHDAVIGIARGLTNDGDRIALLTRVMCAISQKARSRLSEYFAPAQEASVGIDDAKTRALHAIRTGARKPAQIRDAARIDEVTWTKVAAALEADGLVRVEGRGRGREYFAASASVEEVTTDAEQTADGEPDGYAASEVQESIRDNVRDLLRSAALQRTELVERLADIEAILPSDADAEIEQLIREGFLLDSGEFIEWTADRAQRASGQTAPETGGEPRVYF